MLKNDFLKRMTTFNHTLFQNAFDVSVQIQDQFEKIGDTMLDQAGWLPADHRNRYNAWLEACKAGRDSYRTYIDEGFKNIESAL